MSPNIRSPASSYLKAYWGPPTALSNFCEEDYNITHYIGEFVNTLSNAAYILLAIHGLRRRRWQTSSLPPFLALAMVGVISGLYHATLKGGAELGDQTSMLVGAAVVLQRVLTLTWSAASASKFSAVLWSTLAAAVAVRFVVEYSSLLEIVFAAMILPACGLSVWRVETETGMSDDEGFRRHGRVRTGVGAAAFITGYALWWADILLCTELRNLRAHIGLPWAFFLELHGWWHILTALGVYAYIDLVEELRYRRRRRLIDVSVSRGKKET